MKESLKVGVSGVRGVVGESFTPQLACSFAQAFGSFVGRGSVVVGRDTRPSGYMIEHAVIAGLQSVGCRPIVVGMVPTPTLLMLTRELHAHGGMAITASHNPAPWNALKFVDRQGLFLDESHAEALFDLYHQQDFALVPEADLPGVRIETCPVASHFQRIARYVDVEAIRLKRFNVAVDCCNGVGALYSAHFLRDVLGCRVVPIFDEPSGLFEREPEPLPQHLGELCTRVVREGCDIGFAQDPDGDRLAIVDEKGRPIGEDMTLAFAVQQVLDAHERGPVVINQSTSRAVEQVARDRGCEVIRTRIGEINVAAAMLRHDAVVGGEHNGGVMVRGVHLCRDSFTAMALVLELMATSGRTVSRLRAAVPDFHVCRVKVDLRGDLAPVILRRLRRDYARFPLDFTDGVFIDQGDAWVHVRRSNTEPVLRITAEGPTAARAAGLAAELRHAVESALDEGKATR